MATGALSALKVAQIRWPLITLVVGVVVVFLSAASLGSVCLNLVLALALETTMVGCKATTSWPESSGQRAIGLPASQWASADRRTSASGAA